MSAQLATKRVTKKNPPSLKPVLASQSPTLRKNSSIIVTPGAKRRGKPSSKVLKNNEVVSKRVSTKNVVLVSQNMKRINKVPPDTCALVVGNLEFMR